MMKHSRAVLPLRVIVAVALCIYMLLNMTAIDLQGAVDYYYKLTNFNDIHVQVVKIPQGAAEEIQNMEGIKEVQGRVSVDVPMEVDDEDEKVKIRLISLPREEEKINILYHSGKGEAKLGNKDVILLEQFAVARDINPGDVITPRINGRLYKLKVSGKQPVRICLCDGK